MDLSYILDRITQEGRESVPSEQLDRLRNQINSAYYQISQKFPFTELKVDATTTAVGDQREYILPPDFERFVVNSLRYDYIAGVQPGHFIIGPTPDPLTQSYQGVYSGNWPRSFTIGQGSGSSLTNTGTVSIDNRMGTVTGVGTAWPSSYSGEWIVFHGPSSTGGGASGISGYGYAHQITDVDSTTSLSISEPYRGPNLSGVRYTIRPSTRRIIFNPGFSEDGKTIAFSYYRRPRRLYNDEDMPEVNGVEEAIVYKVLSMNSQFHRDGADTDRFEARFRQAWGNLIAGR